MTGFDVFCRMPSGGPATNFYDGLRCPWSLAHSLDLLRAVKVDEGAVGAPSAPTQRLAHLTLDIKEPRVPRRLSPARTDFGVLRAPKYPKRKERGGGGRGEVRREKYHPFTDLRRAYPLITRASREPSMTTQADFLKNMPLTLHARTRDLCQGLSGDLQVS